MEKYITFPRNKPGNIVKWKIKEQSSFSSGTTLCLFKLSGEDNIQKLKATEIGTVVDIVQPEGTTVSPGSHLLRVQGCKHPIVMKDMCAECGADLREALGVAGDRKDSTSASVAMVHSVPELIVSEKEAVELGREDEIRLTSSRKLVLLVDLDETLLHTTNDNVPANLKDVYHFQLLHGRSLLWYHTKFRPGTKKFLDSISNMYELHICTFGARMYAHTMARYIDPEGKYFSHRILSRDECFDPRSKTANLKSLFPCGDSMVCIIDDREEVWNFVPNLIQVKPYIFFDGTADINAPPGLDKPGKEGSKDAKPRRNVKITRVPKVRKSNGGKNTKNAEESIDAPSNLKTDLKEVVSKSGVGSSQVEGTNASEEQITVQEESSGQVNKEKDLSGNAALESVAGESGSEDKLCLRYQGLQDNSADEINKRETGQVNKQQEGIVSIEMVEDFAKQDALDDKECIDVSEIGETEDLPMDTEAGSKGTEAQVKAAEDGRKTNELEKGQEMKMSDSKEDSNIDETGNNSKASTNEDQIEDEFEEVIEWEDSDDYLLHLEDILTRIHTVYYDMADKVIKKSSAKSTESVQQTADEIPDLKKIIPYVKKKVLQGRRLVFSSVVPTNQPLEKSRAFQIAKSLGAEVQKEVTPRVGDTNNYTTHLVAAKLGTQKVKAASKIKGTYIVTPDWLWNCNERWEHVDERLFLLDEKNQAKDGYDSPGVAMASERKKRKAEESDAGALYDPETGKRVFKKARSVDENKNNDIVIGTKETEETMDIDQEGKYVYPPAVASVTSRRFSDTINPLYTFSKQDREDMDKEVEAILDDDESDSQDSSNVVKQQGMKQKLSSTPELEDDLENSEDSNVTELELRRKVLGQSAESSSEDSMSGDFPKGWKKRKTSPKREYDDNSHLFEIDDPGEANLALLKAAQSSPHYLFDESGSDSSENSVGSADEEMAAALEHILYK